MDNHTKNKLSGNRCASVRGVTGNLHAVLADASYNVTGHRALLTTTCSVTANRRALLTNASYSVTGHRRALL